MIRTQRDRSKPKAANNVETKQSDRKTNMGDTNPFGNSARRTAFKSSFFFKLMTRSHPSARKAPTFSSLDVVPMTVQPSALASCTAKDPVPPAAAAGQSKRDRERQTEPNEQERYYSTISNKREACNTRKVHTRTHTHTHTVLLSNGREREPAC